MKKRVAILLLVVLLIGLLPLISASEQTQVDSAYSYLINQADGKWSTLDAETGTLALMALSYDDRLATDGKNTLWSKSFGNKCWPSSACNAKDTSLAIIALNRLGENVDDPVNWLISLEKPFQVSGLTWYLQIDSSVATNCTVSYETTRQITDKIVINKDRSYSLSSSSCLALSSDRYFLQIKGSCLGQSFSVSCNDPAQVSLPYKLSSTLYVEPDTSSTPTEVSINTICMKQGASCDYEGTLWGAYALQKNGKDFSALMPYLISEADNNQKILPNALLFLLTTKNDYAQNLLSQQLREGYWTDVGGYGRYWDTALSSLALSDYSPDNVTTSRSWLLQNQNPDGSWGTYKIRDTSFALFSLWAKPVTSTAGDCISKNYFCRTSCQSGETQTSLSCTSGVCCQPAAGACTTVSDCSKSECWGQTVVDSTGNKGVCLQSESSTSTGCSDNFDNDNNGLTDLADSACQKSCQDLAGTECSQTENCNGQLRTTLETDRCCLGTCQAATQSCPSQGGTLCADTCSGSKVASSDATAYNSCCIGKCAKPGLSITFWIILIIILLALAGGLYYAYKKKYLDKYLGSLDKIFKRKPRAPPSSPAQQQIGFRPSVKPLFQPSPQQYPRPIERRIPTATDSELEDTLGKLKKFSEK